MTLRPLFLALFASAAGTLLCAAQQPVATNELLKRLQSSDPMQRLVAFEALKSVPGSLTSPAGSRILVDLVDAENKLVDASFLPGAKSVGERYGEGYGEYYSEVLGLCDQHCDKRDPRNAGSARFRRE